MKTYCEDCKHFPHLRPRRKHKLTKKNLMDIIHCEKQSRRLYWYSSEHKRLESGSRWTSEYCSIKNSENDCLDYKEK